MLADEQITQVDAGGTEDDVSSSDPGTSEDNVSSSETETVDYVTSEQFAQLLTYVASVDEQVSGLAPATGNDVDAAADAVVAALGDGGSGTNSVVVLSEEQYAGFRELLAGSVVGSLCVCAVLSLVAGLLVARAFAGRWSHNG